MGIQLPWMLLPTAENSNTSERTELLDRLRTAFPDTKITALMGDRKLVGTNGWPICSARRSLLSCVCVKIRMPGVEEEFTKEGLAIEVLGRLVSERGAPFLHGLPWTIWLLENRGQLIDYR